MDISAIKAKTARIEHGDWVDGLVGLGDLGLKVRGGRSAAFRAARDKRIRALGSSDRDKGGTVKPEIYERLMRDSVIEAGLVDWRNLTSGGEPLPYDPAIAADLLADPTFYSAVTDAMTSVDLSMAEAEETTLGNSATSSTGSSATASTPQP